MTENGTPRTIPPVDLGPLRAAADVYGDVVTAYVDVSRTDQEGAREVELRCRQVSETLVEAGAPEDMVQAVTSGISRPTGHGGEASRVVVAHGGEVVSETLVAGRLQSSGHLGPIAHQCGLARVLADRVRYVLVVVDKTGADITVADTVGLAESEIESQGEHEVLHKVGGGGWAHRRLQSRVEDSWDRNADQVARDLEACVTRESPDVVLLTGDPYAVSRVAETVGGPVSDILEQLDHGSRADGASEELLDQDVEAALQRIRSRRIDTVLDKLGAAEGRKAVGVGETLDALRAGQVETLILLDGALEDRQAAVGPEPLHLGHTADEVSALGVDAPATDRLDEAMVRAAIGQDADLLALHAPVGALPDGVGAVLRFATAPQ